MFRRLLRPLRDTLAGACLSAAHRLASDSGWADMLGHLGAPTMLGGLMSMRRLGLEPRRIIDGGACHGDWTRLVRQVFPQTEILMVEPQARHAADLRRLALESGGRIRFAPCLVGPHVQEAIDFVVLDDDSGGTGSSVLPENSDVPRHVVSMPMTTLDSLVDQIGFGMPDFIKLDVQGYELEVLSGATRCLSAAQAVLLEVSLWPYNQGSPLVAEVLPWMDRHGFRAFDVFDISRRPMDGITVQMDVLYLRRDHPLLAELQARTAALGVRSRSETP